MHPPELSTVRIRHIAHQESAEMSAGEWLLLFLTSSVGLLGLVGTLVIAWMAVL